MHAKLGHLCWPTLYIYRVVQNKPHSDSFLDIMYNNSMFNAIFLTYLYIFSDVIIDFIIVYHSLW